MGFPGGSGVKNLPANTGDSGSISGSGRSTGEGNGNPLQCFRLGSPMDRGAWWAAVPGVTRVRHNLVTKPPHHHRGLDKLAEKAKSLPEFCSTANLHRRMAVLIFQHLTFS